uniref:NAD(P)/FAD-dependent oxidoreductase n=1 Tax=Paractinoplanes polyasparticus TaxID=2856853 RepID=UPI001C84D718|nr:FAD-dependent monooxygenase [Actinoplanes polyasparticus]
MTFIDTACVVGGSFAGLLAARVLADHVGRVVVLERDDPAHGRPSVPQSRHGHFLQPEALEQLERWFPGFTDEAVVRGAVRSAPGHHRIYAESNPLPDWDTTMLMASRGFLEEHLRRHVVAIPEVEFRRTRATGLHHSGKSVTGVVTTDGTLRADLTVDATGRATNLGRWLEQSGFPAPISRRLRVGVGYTTMLFRRKGDPAPPAISCALDQFTLPAEGRGLAAVAAYAIEGKVWQVVGIAYGRNRGEATIDNLRQICAGLPDVFREATLGDVVGDVATFFYGESLRRSITDLEAFPSGLVNIGDAVATYDPIRGLGMASAARQATILGDFLEGNDDPAGRSRDFLRLRESAVDQAWKMASVPRQHV